MAQRTTTKERRSGLANDEKRPGERWRAPYACDPAGSRGRLYAEPASPTRSPFQRDRDRILHSNAFRRLKHKTQVFIHHEGDHFRTRLTHTLEVAQIARSIARPLGLDEDLCEAISLGHDLGHPPFGHAGERALDEALSLYGGFDHNAQSLRVVTMLERRYPLFDGLNLTWETLEGLVKHNGPLTDADGTPIGSYAGQALPFAIRAYIERHDLELHQPASIEAQVAAIADDIAYDTHDIDDGLRAGLLSIADLEDAPLSGPILADIVQDYPNLDHARLVHELVRRLITAMIEDVIAETRGRLDALAGPSPEAARDQMQPVVAFSGETANLEAALKRFLFENLYRSDAVMRPVKLAEAAVADLYGAFLDDPSLMPEEWQSQVDPGEPPELARHIADYIAGMTDRFALSEHRRLFDATPDLG
jgi:dGTPase